MSVNEAMPLSGGGRTAVSRRGDVVLRAGGPWSRTVMALLAHLQEVGYASSPLVAGDGIDPDGRETLVFVEGASAHPGPWPAEVLPRIGAALRELHHATATFRPPDGGVWREWYGSDLGAPAALGHCDAAPCNAGGYELTRAGRTALVDRMVEVAVADGADQARDVRPDRLDSPALWAIAWRTRSAAWMLRNRQTLEQALA